MVLAFGIYDRIWFGKIKHSFAEYEVRHKLLPAAITAVNNEVINLEKIDVESFETTSIKHI